ncbi:MAG: redoxin domain-containing protein [Planctomycetes bacterium]|nr:redoxin domain-containing protein [Planctomycetota bacterium]
MLGLFVVGVLAGCNDSASPNKSAPAASVVLDRTMIAYNTAMTYADSGEVIWKYTLDGQTHEERFPWSVTLERPNKLRAHMYAATIVCDGKDFWASLADVPNQVVKLTAPPVLTSERIFATPILLDEMTNRIASASVALPFLVDDDPQRAILQNGAPRHLEPQTIDQSPCYGIAIERQDGQLKLWIDQVTYVIRRIEFPLDAMRQYMSTKGKLGDMSLVGELRGAQLNGKIDPVAFKFEPPVGAKVLSEFEITARPEPPTALLGTQPGDFQFVGLDGAKIDLKALAGKTTVLAVWAASIPTSVDNLPYLQAVYDQFKGDQRVRFLAVSIDAAPASGPVQVSTSGGGAQLPVVTNQELESTLAKAKVTIPIARDTHQQTQKALGIIPLPSIVILGPTGIIEDHLIGVEPELSKLLPARLETVLAGKHVYAEAKQRHEDQLRKYEQQFQTSNEQAPLLKAELAAASQPQQLQLKPLWKSVDVAAPGNVLAVADGDTTKLFVLDGLTTVVEFDAAGKVVARHELDLPKEPQEGVVSYLRTAFDASGARWFAGTVSNQQQVHVFDANWKRQFSYPDGESSTGIADVQFGDLDGDGQPELNVGYFGVVGIHNVTLDKRQRHWSNRSVANVFGLAVVGPDISHRRQLWCANEQGTIAVIDHQGVEGLSLAVANRFIRLVRAADLNGDGEAEVIGVATSQQGEDTLVGIDGGGRELWNYPLPPGLQTMPALEMIGWGPTAAGSKQQSWIVAGPDGSVHLIGVNGRPIDRWNHGSAISGLALVRAATPMIVIASGKSVQAWSLEPAGK